MHGNTGMPRSEETKIKIRNAHLGKHLSDEHKRKIGLSNSIANKGHIPWMAGKHHTAETKKKLSHYWKGKIKIPIDKDELIDLYFNKRWTAKRCSEHFKCSKCCIVDRMKLLGFKQRTKSEAKIGSLNPIYGKTPHNKGKSPSKETIEKQRIKLKEMYASGKIIHFSKGKTYREVYGTQRAEHIRNKLVKSHVDYLRRNPSERKRLNDLRVRMVVPVRDTSIEIKIQNFLKTLNIQFISHHYMGELTKRYLCDIFIPATNTVIECDGDYWHGNPKFFPSNKLVKHQITRQMYDAERTSEMIKMEYRVIRLWECDIEQMKIGEFSERLFSNKFVGVSPELTFIDTFDYSDSSTSEDVCLNNKSEVQFDWMMAHSVLGLD